MTAREPLLIDLYRNLSHTFSSSIPLSSSNFPPYPAISLLFSPHPSPIPPSPLPAPKIPPPLPNPP